MERARPIFSRSSRAGASSRLLDLGIIHADGYFLKASMSSRLTATFPRGGHGVCGRTCACPDRPQLLYASVSKRSSAVSRRRAGGPSCAVGRGCAVGERHLLDARQTLWCISIGQSMRA